MKSLLTCLLLILSLPAHSEQYAFRHYRNEEGLSNNTILCTLQDANGFVWFGTKEGLNRFDGIRFVTFFHSPDNQNSLISNSISTLAEDSRGQIWIGTDRGICCYNPENGLFTRPDPKEHPVSGAVSDIKEDASGNIWYIEQAGIFRYSPATKKLDHFASNHIFAPTSICITSANEIWFSSADGKLYHYDSRSNQFKGYPVLTKKESERSVLFFKVREGSGNRFLILTDKAGVKRFDPTSETTTTLFDYDADGHPILPNDIVQSGDLLWVGSESGIHLYDERKGLVHHIKNLPADPYSLSNNAVKTVTKDREGGIWFGTYYGGINYLPRENTPFTKYYATSTPGSLQGNVVKAICSDATGNLWIGTEDAGLNQFDPRTGQFYDFTPTNAKASVLSANIQGLLVCGDTLWIGTYENGIYLFDLREERVKAHFCTQDKNSGLRSNYIFTFLLSKEGTLYAGTAGGLVRFNPTAKRFEGVAGLPRMLRVQALHEDQRGDIWAGTLGRGLYIIGSRNGTIRHFSHDPGNRTSLGSDYVTSIFEDSKNQIWCTTEGNGFCKLNSTDSTFLRFDAQMGVTPGITCGILEDKQGGLWISSTNGLLRLAPQNLEIIQFKRGNGLPENHFSYNATFRDSTGRLFFGTVNGMIAFDPEHFTPAGIPSKVFITGFQTDATSSQRQEAISEPGKSILYSKKVILSHRQSTFSIDFAAPGYTDPALVRYRYKLEGTDSDWNLPAANRRAYYTNIAPGHYRFVVAAAGADNNWEYNRAYLEIVIRPPLWRSNAALLLYLLLFGTVVTLFIRIYTHKRQLETEHRMERLKREKATELLNAKIDFFTNITHEVRTPLTLIKAPLDRLLTGENSPGAVTENLTLMKKNTDRLLELTRQLLDFRKVENDRLQLNYTEIDAARFMEEICNRFLPAAKENHIALELNMPHPAPLLRADKESLTKMLSNLLSNALKYTHNQITVSIEYPNIAPKRILFRVNSNGETIPSEFHEKIFEPFFMLENHQGTTLRKGTGLGLSLARSLAELHCGRLYLDSSAMPLNCFVLELPLGEGDNASVSADTASKERAIRPKCVEHKETDRTRLSVLVVEDEPGMRTFLASELSPKYNVYVASNGNEALDVIKEHGVNLIVSDVLMPVFDGYQLCRTIKQKLDYSHIPVILLTASTSLNARIEGLECGADAYLEKPFTTQLLLAQIENLFRNREVASKNFMHSPYAHYKTVAVNKIDEEFMRHLHAEIIKHMAEPHFSVETLAGAMGMSISTLYRKVKALTNLNTNEYIRVFRLKKAAEMLASKQYRISEVSYLTGFASASYFTTSFQKQFGLSPSQFLKQQPPPNQESDRQNETGQTR